MTWSGVGDLLWRAGNEAAERVFARYATGATITYGDQLARSGALAGYLHDRGLGRGDRVLLMLDNEPAFVDAWFACALGGLVMVPVNTAMHGPLLDDLLVRVRPAAAIAAAGYTGRLGAGLGDAVRLVAAGTADGSWDPLPGPGDTPPVPPVPVGRLDPMSIIFTSGTTGRSKGVILSHAHCIARSTSYVEGLGIDRTDVMYTCLPLFHNNAQMASVLVALLVRGAVAISPRFSVSRFWEEISRFDASRVTLIGRMANQLLELTGGGAPAHRLRTACIVPPPRGGSAFAERFSVRVVSQYYGSTEMIPMPPDLGQAERPGSCGRPGPGYVCDVVDEEGYPVPAGVVGELVVRPRLPEGMMLGYLDMPEATLEAFRGLWFHTGDAMRRDDEGFYYLEGRLADFVRNRGENIAAQEVEALVEEHPVVVAAAAVGEPDEWGEERLVLYVEPRHGADAAAVTGAVTAHCAAVLPEFMRPHEVVVVPELPRNALGRVEKRRLARPADPN